MWVVLILYLVLLGDSTIGEERGLLNCSIPASDEVQFLTLTGGKLIKGTEIHNGRQIIAEKECKDYYEGYYYAFYNDEDDVEESSPILRRVNKIVNCSEGSLSDYTLVCDDVETPYIADPIPDECRTLPHGNVTDNGQSFECNKGYVNADPLSYERYSCSCDRDISALVCNGRQAKCKQINCKLNSPIEQGMILKYKGAFISASTIEAIDHGESVTFNCEIGDNSVTYEPKHRRFKCDRGNWIEHNGRNAWSLGSNGTFPKCRPAKCDCQHGSTCIRDATCVCIPFSKGARCEITICHGGCQNGGNCTSPNRCTCPKRFYGNHCETEGCGAPIDNLDDRVYRIGETYAVSRQSCSHGSTPSFKGHITCNNGHWSEKANCFTGISKAIDAGTPVVVKLVDGPCPSTGRVELIVDGRQGTICDHEWDNNDATVICRMLGYSSGEARMKGWYGPGNDRLDILFDDVECDGTESSIIKCGHRGIGTHDCGHGEDAGVVCYRDGEKLDQTPEEEVSNFVCGRRPKDVTDRIVGGFNASKGHYPWQAGVRTIEELSGHSHLCGGTILNEHWILSAAHCFKNKRKSEILVRTGDHDNSVTDDLEQEFELEELINHPCYDGRRIDFDLALLKVKSRYGAGIKFNDDVQPACLPQVDTPYTVRKKCHISGWGTTNTNYPNLLNAAEVPIIDDATCARMYTHISPNMVCAGYLAGGIDTCQGDSGGPLVCEINGVYSVMGVTSFGRGCAKPNAPGVYARVTAFIPWIKATFRKKRYRIRVKTADWWLSGTDGEVYLFMSGSKGSSGKVVLKGKYEAGDEDDTNDLFVDVGEISSIRLGVNAKSHYFDGWRPEFVVIEDVSRGAYYKFVHDLTEIVDTSIILYPEGKLSGGKADIPDWDRYGSERVGSEYNCLNKCIQDPECKQVLFMEVHKLCKLFNRVYRTVDKTDHGNWMTSVYTKIN